MSEKEDNSKDNSKENEDKLMKIKKTHGVAQVYEIVVGSRDNEKTCYIKQPTDRKILSKIITSIGEKDLLTAGDIILNSCWLQGDKEIMSDTGLYTAASLYACQAIEIPEGRIEKK